MFSLTCGVKLMFEGKWGFLIFSFVVCWLFVQNIWGPKETKKQEFYSLIEQK